MHGSSGTFCVFISMEHPGASQDHMTGSYNVHCNVRTALRALHRRKKTDSALITRLISENMNTLRLLDKERQNHQGRIAVLEKNYSQLKHEVEYMLNQIQKLVDEVKLINRLGA